MKIFVSGHQGMLAQELVGYLRQVGVETMSQGRPVFDLSQETTIREALVKSQPDIVINTAAYTAVDQAESEPHLAFLVNREGAAHLATVCQELGIPLIHISTDYIFDGTACRPYREDDVAAPLGVYGESKWLGEQEVRRRHPQHLIVRTAWLYSRHGDNFLKTMLRLARERDVLRVVDDQYGCPTWCRDVAAALVTMCQHIMRDRRTVPWGTYHFCSTGPATWYDFAHVIIEEAKTFESLQVREIVPIPTAAYPTPARRPVYSLLDCEKSFGAFGLTSCAWRERLHDCLQELYTCTPISPETS